MPSLPLHCVHCHGAVAIQLSGEPQLGQKVKQRHVWTCPYCGKENGVSISVGVEWVTKGHGPEPNV